ncbi:MAG: Ig-like domain-containing protein, partial [Bacteroidia bacterium]|nr:Ig-like domain-containing protein [Bacteroidia bacterium]
AIDSVLTITMSEAVLKVNTSVTIYANGLPFETVNSNSDLMVYSGNTIKIGHVKQFPNNAHISVKLPVKFARDSSFNLVQLGIDTIDWNFNTQRDHPRLQFISPDSGAQLVKNDEKPYMLYDTRLHKLSNGGVTIYENSVVKEFIPVTSSRIKVSGKVVEILNTLFDYDKLVCIVIDSCLADTFGNKILPLAYGRWVFNTKTLPVIESLVPNNQAALVDPSTTLTINFDRYMRIDSNKLIKIYSNGVLYKSIAMNSPEIYSNGTVLSITIQNGLPGHSRIGIELPKNALKDNFNTYFAGSDTSSWTFTTSGRSSLTKSQAVAIQVFPNPVEKVLIINSGIPIETLFFVDVLGKVYEMQLTLLSDNTYELQTEHLNSGIYSLIVNGLVIEQRILKQ